MKRIFLIVADSLGVGATLDAASFKPVAGGDAGSNTLLHIIEKTGGLNAPTLQKMGLANILSSPLPSEGERVRERGFALWPPLKNPIGLYGKMMETSAGKDTPSGHWEIAGCPVPFQMPVYYDGLPQEMLDRFVNRSREKGIALPGVLGGQPASGTQIIDELGEESVKTGKPIVYTSGDSVFQIAAHEKYFGLQKLYTICKIAREVLDEYPDKIGRVIARPFVGETKQDFKRTANRHDYSIEPVGTTILDVLKKKKFDVIAVGKIGDIFAHRGTTQEIHSENNADGMEILAHLADKNDWQGLAFINLCDFDVLYGHRRNTEGYRKSIEEFDVDLGQFLTHLQKEDLLIITADHGCDPTFPGTDHTREYVPVLVYSSQLTVDSSRKHLGTRSTFADVAATVARFLGVEFECNGVSMI